MAKYTTQLKSLVNADYPLFDFDYPIFDEAYRSVLETKFINHFYFREIGLETAEQFKWFLKEKFNRIMPYYNQLYESNEVFKTYDPYKNKNVTTTDKRTTISDSEAENISHGTGSANSSGTNKGTDIFSDTPQAKLQGLDYATNVTDASGESATESGTIQDTTDNTTGNVTTTDNYTQTIAGHDGMKYPAGILAELRDTFMNIDQMILDDCQDLFMNVY